MRASSSLSSPPHFPAFDYNLKHFPEVEPLAKRQDWAKNEASAKHFGRARQLYRKAADQYASVPQAWMLWGKLEQELQKYDRARELFTKGLQASNGENEIMSHALAMLEKVSM
jgi:tetratricopeptide (TPR) repeat protein